jgi:hypothetical protein
VKVLLYDSTKWLEERLKLLQGVVKLIKVQATTLRISLALLVVFIAIINSYAPVEILTSMFVVLRRLSIWTVCMLKGPHKIDYLTDFFPTSHVAITATADYNYVVLLFSFLFDIALTFVIKIRFC